MIGQNDNLLTKGDVWGTYHVSHHKFFSFFKLTDGQEIFDFCGYYLGGVLAVNDNAR